MTFSLRRPLCVMAGLVLLISPRAQTQEANDSFAWIETPVGKHVRLARRRELILLHAARVAEERGYTHFELMRTAEEPAEGGVDADAWKVTDAYGNASNPTHFTPLSSSPVHPRGAVLVRFCNESVESCPGVRAHRVFLDLRPEN